MNYKEDRQTTRNFSFEDRAKSFSHAWRGIGIFIKTTHNAWLQIGIFVVVILAGFLLQITKLDWVLIILSGGMVLVSEAFNTALEIDIDLTSPEFHPYARDTKDVAAGAVLIASIVALFVGLIIFIPYIVHVLLRIKS